MIENKHYIALELNKILKILANETTSKESYNMVLNTVPCFNLDTLNKLLKETDDAYVLIGKFGAPPFSELKDIYDILKRADTGGLLNSIELLTIANTLECIRKVKQYRENLENTTTCLDYRFKTLMPNKYLENKIKEIIISSEEIADNATEKLHKIRADIRNFKDKARDKINKLIQSSLYVKYLQEPIITVRNERLVLPVKLEYKSNIPGLVHDTSASGSTLFIEPMQVLEINNKIRELQSAEKHEIERIMYELTSVVSSYSENILNSYSEILKLDVIFAKAKLAYKMKASRPTLNNEGKIILKNARHPLIKDENVVPIDIKLGIKFDTLIITGPNTGGKTASLKTLGLLTLMAMCGLMIPADENSEVAVYNKILVDIGDEQSIEQSLSTFSSHMVNIINIINKIDKNDLVLLDELGAGTDPIEGAALAIAIIEKLRSKGCKIIATTHYAELKAYALQNEGIENASCEFDIETLKPTFKLLLGIPGKSNAFSISESLGLDKNIIKRASELVANEDAEFEQAIKKLQEAKLEIDKEREEAFNIKKYAEQERKKFTELKEKTQKQYEIKINEAKVKAENIISSTIRESEKLIDEIKKVKKSNKDLDIQDKVNFKKSIKDMEKKLDSLSSKNNEGYKLPRELKVGDSVLIFDLDKVATVLKTKDNNGNVLVQAGIIKTKVPINNLRLIKEEKVKLPARMITKNINDKGTQNLGNLDLRGMDSIEAIMELDNFIDSAMITGMPSITIIHGKGTGKLREEVKEHLKKHKAIKSFRIGSFGEGETGVTIAELK